MNATPGTILKKQGGGEAKILEIVKKEVDLTS
jgi:hypothetical protein